MNPQSIVEINPAFKSLNDSIRQFPKDASLYLRRASRLTQENAHELAYTDFLKAWSLQPGLENGLPFAANLEILNRLPERTGLLESLHQQFSSNAQVGRLLADAYAASGKPDQAMLIYNGILSKDSLDPETLYEKALLLEQDERYRQGHCSTPKGLFLSRAWIPTGWNSPICTQNKKISGRWKSVIIYLKHDSAGLLIDPLFIKGIYFANTKQYPKAIVQFDSCIQRDWKTTDAYLEKGRAYFHMKNINAAMQTFNMAITVTNTDPDAYYWLGRCYEVQHQKMDAINNYRKAISLDKDFTEARQRIENLDSGFAHPSH